MPLPREVYKQGTVFIISILGILLLIIVFSAPIMGMFALGPIVSPGGIFSASYGSAYSSKTISVEGIEDTVTIKRDNWGIPHIYAKTLEDAFFGLGYCHAMDRLFQMEMTARTGMGRMSEILGNDSLEDDIFYHTLGFEKAAKEALATYKSERETDSDLDKILDVIDAYCEGVNYEIKHRIRTKTLPIEFKLLGFEPTLWTPVKIFVYSKLMSQSLSYSNNDLHATILLDQFFNGNETAMEELFPLNQTHYQVPIIPSYGNYSFPTSLKKAVAEDGKGSSGDIEARSLAIKKILENTPESVKLSQQPGIGSNNWVADGTKTVTGKPILAGDPHLSISLPMIWYEAHLVASNENLNIFGYTLTGVPTIIIGCNTHVAWSMTNVGNDACDWYEYVWNADKSQYWSGNDNKWKSPIERTVSLSVKGLGNHTETIRYTEDGVIMAEAMGKTMVAMRWTATESTTYELKGLYGANKATNWEEFNESMQWFHDPPQNIVFADSDGNIALRPTGRIVKRNFTQAYQGRFMQNGSDPNLDKDWEYIPFDELPYALNPPQGYLSSANQKSTGPDYPYYISSYQSSCYRGRSIDRHLREAEDGSVDVDFMKDAQCGDMGILDISSESFTPFFIDAADQSGEISSGTTAANALAELKEWNNSNEQFLMDKDLVGPTIFYETMSWFRRYVWQDDYDEAGISVKTPQDEILEYFVKNEPDSKWFDNVTTDANEDRDDIIVKAFIKAVEELEDEFGSNVDDWTYGEYHVRAFNHMAGIPSFGAGSHPHDGSGNTLLAAGGRRPGTGPSERMVVDFNNISNSWSVLPGGASGNPANPHYADQAIELWMEGKYHLMLIEYDKAEEFPKEHTEATVVLKPK
ncbi:MAG: penicillin acylase family protein [Candidatus Hodarchaeales archaeon]|jgi:penicillin amidase